MSCLWYKKSLPRPLSREKVTPIDYLANTYHKNTTVSHILRLIRGRKCFDERDYVYGVLGLLPLEFQTMITPNYELTAAEVYTNLTVSYLKQGRDLNILKDCQIEGRNKEHGLPSWVPDLSRKEQWTSPIQWQNAAGDSEAVVDFTDSHTLEVGGVVSATVDFAEEVCLDHTDTRIQNIFRLFGIQGIDPENGCDEGDNVALAKFCNTLAGGYLRDRFPNETLPSVKTWKTEVANPKYLHKLTGDNSQDNCLQFHEQWVSSLIQKRGFFKTRTGFIGLGPRGLKQGDLGDMVVVLLGCDSPLVLRPTANSRYNVIGECYVDETKDAAALLEPLSPKWHVQVYKDFIDKRGVYRFLDRETGKLHDEDPRMSELAGKLALSEERGVSRDECVLSTHGLTGSTDETLISYPLKPETLMKFGLPLQKFLLS